MPQVQYKNADFSVGTAAVVKIESELVSCCARACGARAAPGGLRHSRAQDGAARAQRSGSSRGIDQQAFWEASPVHSDRGVAVAVRRAASVSERKKNQHFPQTRSESFSNFA